MSGILCLETATKVCSVALSENDNIVFEKISYNGPSHAALLGLFVKEAIDFACDKAIKIDAIAISSGPGSYTGLRIGVSEAKGLCYGLDIPLISVPTLEIMASQVINSGYQYDYYCPMIDARRMEAYTAIYDNKLTLVKEISADIVDGNSYTDFLSHGKMLFFGDGSAKCKEIIGSPNACFLDNIFPHAISMLSLANKYLKEKKFEDVAYFEPFYLKEFQATKAKNLINIV